MRTAVPSLSAEYLSCTKDSFMVIRFVDDIAACSGVLAVAVLLEQLHANHVTPSIPTLKTGKIFFIIETASAKVQKSECFWKQKNSG